jgi:drug/metabolite transporter (DMT)-like permease
MTAPHSSALIGQLLGLATAFCWTLSALSFEEASTRVGSLPVNIIRLVLAFALLAGFNWLHRGLALPTDATPPQWKWLLGSGVIGFFVGDLCLFRALVLIGSRTSTLLMSLAPPLAALTGYLVLGEQLSAWSWLGMAVTLGGIVWVISERMKDGRPDDLQIDDDPPPPDLHASQSSGAASTTSVAVQSPSHAQSLRAIPLWGITLGILGAAGQGVGLVLAKLGMRGLQDQQYDPFAATQIRAIAGIAGFALFVFLARRTRDIGRALTHGRAMVFTTLGAIAGPFIGVSLLNASIQLIPTGMAQTLAAIVPVIIIPFVIVTKKERVSLRALLGAIVAVAGVAMLLRGNG